MRRWDDDDWAREELSRPMEGLRPCEVMTLLGRWSGEDWTSGGSGLERWEVNDEAHAQKNSSGKIRERRDSVGRWVNSTSEG